MKTRSFPPAQRLKRTETRNLLIQAAVTFLTNARLSGYWTRTIYSGNLKKLCVPGLNCYSCPGALGSCPIGALQNSLYDTNQIFPFYVLGFLLLFGSLLGRAVCGLLCPFGFLQDLLGKISRRKWRPEITHPRLDCALRKIKYANLFLLALILPFLGRFVSAFMAPWFCKLVCPAGTVGAGWIHVGLDRLGVNPINLNVGWLFGWKSLLAAGILTACVFIPRFFCRYLCPLGAFYGFFNRFALYRLRFDEPSCIRCGACAGVCPMGIRMPEKNQSAECIRCGKCAAVCPKDCLACGFGEAALSEKRRRYGSRSYL